ncbi:hypothetical protein VMCG_02057 [Cytospora schulzeri]|uniref:MalT-like TPR region domain-containing protein n=1 Tax=Cytospora schulzeri TaxID=448051 RepID=A0A423X3Z5_9PEZI|nr:hypothetical protein VMCG_02057 [Valsa malicola]
MAMSACLHPDSVPTEIFTLTPEELYLFEKYQFHTGRWMVKEALQLCYEAGRIDTSTGWPADWALPRLSASLYLQLGSIEYESHTDGHGLKEFMESKDIRQQLINYWNDDYDVRMMQVCQSNVSVALMAEGRPDEAVAILEEIYDKADAKVKTTVVYTNSVLNLGLALGMTGHHEEAIAKLEEATRVISENFGENGAEMATKFYVEALRILQNVDPTSRAIARTARQLQLVLEATGHTAIALETERLVHWCLSRHGLLQDGRNSGYSDRFFDTLVLFKFS